MQPPKQGTGEMEHMYFYGKDCSGLFMFADNLSLDIAGVYETLE